MPLRDLALDADTHGNILWNVMAELEGSWEFYAGGNQAEDILILNADGTYTGKCDSICQGVFHHKSHNLFPQRLFGVEWENFGYSLSSLTRYSSVPSSNLRSSVTRKACCW